MIAVMSAVGGAVGGRQEFVIMDWTVGFIQNIGPLQWIVVLAVGLLFFGRRLPEVGRSLGRSIVEFKKGLKGLEDDANDAAKPREDKYLPRQDAPAESRRVSTNDKVEEQV